MEINFFYKSKKLIRSRSESTFCIIAKMKGYIYCVSNPSFKANIFKIGYTTMNLNKRINSLYKTGVPTKFVINFAKTVQKCYKHEQEIHVLLDKYRFNPSREFFKCPLQTIKTVFESIEGVWWKDEAVEEEKEEEKIKEEVEIKKTNKVTNRKKLVRKVKKVKINYKV